MSDEVVTMDASFLGTGWTFPPVFDNATHLLQLNGGVDNINQSIDVLLKTAQGSRSMMPDFGCNLSSFLFQRLDATLQGEIAQMVKVTLLKSEPRIMVNSVAVSQSSDYGRIDILVSYVIKSTNTRHNYVYPFSLTEATNLDLGG
jgi:phage baseplate assembly protein W